MLRSAVAATPPLFSRSFLTLAVLLAAFLALVAPTPAQAQNGARTTNFRAPFSFYVYNECENEFVLVEGEFHGQNKMVVDKKTGAVSFAFKVNAHGTGVGLESGIEYVFNDTFRDTFTSGPGNAFQFSTNFRTRLISPGSEENLFILFHNAFGVDENGNVVIDEFSIDFECHG